MCVRVEGGDVEGGGRVLVCGEGEGRVHSEGVNMKGVSGPSPGTGKWSAPVSSQFQRHER